MKTLSAQSARLVAALNDRSSRIFTLDEAAGILDAPPNVVSNLLGKAERRGIVTRLRRGIYTLVPSEMGSEMRYAVRAMCGTIPRARHSWRRALAS